jgi:outer membrane receptor protein involved in Fe transport
MKKLIFYIISILCVTSFAQDDGNPAVELPDFVITGKDVVMVRRVEKIPADLISVISDEYTKPMIKPEKLEVAGITKPVSWDRIDFDSTKFYRGYISVESGRYKLPASQINYTFPFERGMINGRINQLNQLAYVNNSERQSIFGALVFNYSLPIDGKFLPGTKFSLGGKHDKNIFKFFGSDTLGLERNLNIGTVNLGIQNLYMIQFIFDINFDGDFTYLEDDNFTEALYSTYAFGRFQAENFGLNLMADFKNQSLKTDSLLDVTSNYYFLRPSVSLELFDKIKTDVGFTFSKSGENNFNALFASLGLELTKNVVLLAEYSPQSEFITAGKLMRGNYYFTQQNLENFFLKKKNKIRASVKYEYDKYYQIDGGVEYYKAENLPYYINPNNSGFFNAASTNATNLNLFLNLIYHLGPYGILYASFDYFNIEDDENRKIPYYPNLKISANYGHDFNNNIRTDLSVHYLSDRYADLDNKIKLNGFFTLDFKFSYKLKEQFLLTLKVENILNTKPFNWQGYQEKQLDASIGFNFLFD